MFGHQYAWRQEEGKDRIVSQDIKARRALNIYALQAFHYPILYVRKLLPWTIRRALSLRTSAVPILMEYSGKRPEERKERNVSWVGAKGSKDSETSVGQRGLWQFGPTSHQRDRQHSLQAGVHSWQCGPYLQREPGSQAHLPRTMVCWAAPGAAGEIIRGRSEG